MRRLRSQSLLGVVGLCAVLGLCACAGAPYRPALSVAAPAFASSGFEARGYPQDFQMVQRVTVDVAGRVFDFTAYLQVRRESGLRGVALGEMGVKVFDLERENGIDNVVSKPKTMPAMPLLDGVIEDLWHLYGAWPGAPAQWVQRPDAVGAVWSRGGGWLDEYQYDAGDGRLIRSWRVAGERVRSVVEYGEAKAFPGWDAALPSRIDVENRPWHYKMTIRLLEIKPLGAGSAAAGQPGS